MSCPKGGGGGGSPHEYRACSLRVEWGELALYSEYDISGGLSWVWVCVHRALRSFFLNIIYLTAGYYYTILLLRVLYYLARNRPFYVDMLQSSQRRAESESLDEKQDAETHIIQ